MARRSKATWIFLAIALGGVALWLWRGEEGARAPQAGAASGSAAIAPPTPSAAANTSLFPPEDRVADAATVAMLGGLRLGDEVREGWRLVGVGGVREGQVAVHLERRGEQAMTVWIARAQPGKPPPHQTARYAITFGGVHPGPVADAEQSEVAKAIRDRVAAVEATVPAPAGL